MWALPWVGLVQVLLIRSVVLIASTSVASGHRSKPFDWTELEQPAPDNPNKLPNLTDSNTAATLPEVMRNMGVDTQGEAYEAELGKLNGRTVQMKLSR